MKSLSTKNLTIWIKSIASLGVIIGIVMTVYSKINAPKNDNKSNTEKTSTSHALGSVKIKVSGDSINKVFDTKKEAGNEKD